MKRIVIILMLLGCVPSARATTTFFAQAAAGANTGADCANAHAISAVAYSAGNTTALCGTITTALSPSSGTAGNVVTVQWQSGASVQVCNTTGAVQISGKSYILLDLGANTNAIECPNNGTGLAHQTTAIGVGDGGNNASNIEIRNGTIGPLYIYTCCGSDGQDTYAITVESGSNNHFHDISFNNAQEAIHQAYGNGISTSGNEFDHNTMASSVGRGVEYANGFGQSTTDTGTLIHDNDIALGTGWQSGNGDFTHIEAILTYNMGSSGTDTLTGMKIYNNYIHGAPSCCTSAYISVYNGLSCPSTNSSWQGSIFNNLLVDTATTGSNLGFGDGMIYMQDCHHNLTVYNNTMDSGSQGHVQGTACVEFEGTNTVMFENNICENFNSQLTNQDGAPTLTANTNDYYNNGSGGWSWNSTSYNTLAAWHTARGFDANSITTIPGLNPNYTIATTASSVHLAGINLTSLAITPLNTGAPLLFGQGNESSVGVPRSASAAWDIGAYAFNGGTNGAPPAPLLSQVIEVKRSNDETEQEVIFLAGLHNRHWNIATL